MTQYLNRHNYINHTHHGSVHGKSTQRLVHKLYDHLLESLEKGGTSALIQTDQSKAYNVVDQVILQKKMEDGSYMDQRKQYMVVDGFSYQQL